MLKRFKENAVAVSIILIVLLVSFILFSMTGEKVAYNNGAGWDGVFYKEVALNFSDKFINGYDTYRIQRLLPFALINTIFNLLCLEKNDANLMFAVQSMNFLVLLFGVVYYFKTVKLLKISIPAMIIGFSAFFLNYPILKMMGYYPYLTDTFALVIAIIQFYLFIKKKTIALIILSVIGAFCWPSLFVCGLLLALWPRTEIIVSKKLNITESFVLKFCKVIAVFFIPTTFLLLYIFKRKFLLERFGETRYYNEFFLVVSLICISLYVFGLLKYFNLPIIENVKKLLFSFKIRNIIIFFILFTVVKSFVYLISNGSALVTFSDMLVGRILTPPTVDPFVFLVSNFMYYGFIVIIMIYLWDKLFPIYLKYGYSFFGIIVLGLIMSLNTESRHLLSFIPFLFFPVLTVISESQIKKINFSFSMFFMLSSIILSRFWYKINVPGIEKAFIDPFENHIGSYVAFPAQRYFMAQGPWMSHQMYLLFLVIFIISIIVLFLYFEKSKTLSKINSLITKLINK